MTQVNPTETFLAYEVLTFLEAMQRAGALSEFQTTRLGEHWLELEDDWASSPYFRNVGEHSRAYIDQFRRPKDIRGEGVSPISTTTIQGA